MEVSPVTLLLFLYGFGTAVCQQQKTFFQPMDLQQETPATISFSHVEDGKDDFLFGKTPRKYVFGGYITRATREPLEPYTTHLQHKRCGAGMYSARPRLNNPVSLHDKALNAAQYEFQVLTYTTAVHLNKPPTMSPVPKLERPKACCPFTAPNLRCCRDYEAHNGNAFLNAIDNSYNRGLLDKVQCSVGQYECSNNEQRCVGLASNWFGLAKEVVNNVPLQQSYELGIRTGYSRAIPHGFEWTEATGRNVDTVIKNQMITPKVTCAMLWSDSLGANKDTYRKYVDSGWGPYPPTGFDVSKLRPFDRGWKKANQCRPCSRFGDNFYTLGEGAFSSCLKAGPGKMANANRTGIHDSEESRYRYIALAKNGDRDVSIYVTWKDDGEGTNSNAASVRVKFHDLANNPIQFEPKQAN